ncbi:hypothetical protein C8Q75DRAFT_736117 [Abortiporus biennis]|nr:hypothetical protein C8Q75DRAFT_736117 [Abortiporus biennis]
MSIASLLVTSRGGEFRRATRGGAVEAHAIQWRSTIEFLAFSYVSKYTIHLARSLSHCGNRGDQVGQALGDESMLYLYQVHEPHLPPHRLTKSTREQRFRDVDPPTSLDSEGMTRQKEACNHYMIVGLPSQSASIDRNPGSFLKEEWSIESSDTIQTCTSVAVKSSNMHGVRIYPQQSAKKAFLDQLELRHQPDRDGQAHITRGGIRRKRSDVKVAPTYV